MFLASSCSCFRSIHWSHVLSWEWRCSWSSADRRCSNYIWVINNFIAYEGATYIRGFTVVDWVFHSWPELCMHNKTPRWSLRYHLSLWSMAFTTQPGITSTWPHKPAADNDLSSHSCLYAGCCLGHRHCNVRTTCCWFTSMDYCCVVCLNPPSNDEDLPANEDTPILTKNKGGGLPQSRSNATDVNTNKKPGQPDINLNGAHFEEDEDDLYDPRVDERSSFQKVFTQQPGQSSGYIVVSSQDQLTGRSIICVVCRPVDGCKHYWMVHDIASHPSCWIHHWNTNVMLTKCSSLAALKVVILTTFSAASD